MKAILSRLLSFSSLRAGPRLLYKSVLDSLATVHLAEPSVISLLPFPQYLQPIPPSHLSFLKKNNNHSCINFVFTSPPKWKNTHHQYHQQRIPKTKTEIMHSFTTTTLTLLLALTAHALGATLPLGIRDDSAAGVEHKGDITFYNTENGMGACGKQLSDSEPICAVSTMLYDECKRFFLFVLFSFFFFSSLLFPLFPDTFEPHTLPHSTT